MNSESIPLLLFILLIAVPAFLIIQNTLEAHAKREAQNMIDKAREEKRDV